MKRTLILCLCAALAAFCVIPVFAVDTGNNLGTVSGTLEVPKLDGVKDDVYKNALVLDGGLLQDDNTEAQSDATYYFIYDAEALWVFCEITDPTLETAAEDPQQPNYKVDSIEVMIDFTNEGENIPDETPLQCRIDHNNLISARAGGSVMTKKLTPKQRPNFRARRRQRRIALSP
ncbi:MAG TPA: hypothetical protein GX704_01775 [Clostridiales bacterium]|nr:hypothetical protein [Clostridiales bacterium]